MDYDHDDPLNNRSISPNRKIVTYLPIDADSGHHYHKDNDGILHRCYHSCRTVVSSWQFWLGMTLGFPFEHYLWEKVWGFRMVTEWLGL